MLYLKLRRGGRVVEGARLESVYSGNTIEGSNPSLSAINQDISQTIYKQNNFCHTYRTHEYIFLINIYHCW